MRKKLLICADILGLLLILAAIVLRIVQKDSLPLGITLVCLGSLLVLTATVLLFGTLRRKRRKWELPEQSETL